MSLADLWFVAVLSVVEGVLVARIEREPQQLAGFDAFKNYAPSRRRVRRVRAIGWAVTLLGHVLLRFTGLATWLAGR